MILKSIKKSFLNETANALSLLILIWGGVAVADIYFNKILGIDLIAFFALVVGIIVGLKYIVTLISTSKLSPNGITYFNFEGQNYYIKSGATTVKNPGAAAIIWIAIKSLVALPIYLFKLILRCFQSIFSEKYRVTINEYYDANETEIKNKLKKGVITSIIYAGLVCIMFLLYGVQCLIYSPRKIKFENVSVEYVQEYFYEGYIVNFDYYSKNNSVMELNAYSSDVSDPILIIKDAGGEIVYKLSNDQIMLEPAYRNESKSDIIYLPNLIEFKSNYKIYLYFDELVARSLFATATRSNLNYEVCIYG